MLLTREVGGGWRWGETDWLQVAPSTDPTGFEALYLTSTLSSSITTTGEVEADDQETVRPTYLLELSEKQELFFLHKLSLTSDSRWEAQSQKLK